MELVGAFFEEEWESLRKMFSNEDSDLMLHLHGSDLFSNQVENGLSLEITSNFLANTEENMAAGFDDTVFFSSDHTIDTTNFNYVSQESSNGSTEIDKVLFPNQENVVNFPDHVINDTFDDQIQSTRFCMMDCKNDHHNLLTVPGFPDDHVGSGHMGNAECQPAGIGDSVKENAVQEEV
ncbi:Transcription factor bHLH [Abeliophyllum distichum]|uniref:Transcription factor bHLH n=1 Tax=Abeliophyllum distichum TaxID=126358 RepID=A0ABD1SZC0_9LAMI